MRPAAGRASQRTMPLRSGPTPGGRSCPSGIRLPHGRIGGLLGWPRRRGTGRGACRPRRRHRGCWFRSRSSLAATLPRWSRPTPSCSSRPSWTGLTKPIASSTRSALSSNSLPVYFGHLPSAVDLLPFDARRHAASRPSRSSLRTMWSRPTTNVRIPRRGTLTCAACSASPATQATCPGVPEVSEGVRVA